VPRGGEFQQGSGQVGDVHRAPHVVGVEGAGRGAGRQRVHEPLVLGVAVVTDDQ
jgi:hypothetical protein